uniref:ApaG domain-containing protein n=1 Tax=Guillardia theta TaxID=55529 RepID=A0A7S4PNH5_GUITH
MIAAVDSVGHVYDRTGTCLKARACTRTSSEGLVAAGHPVSFVSSSCPLWGRSNGFDRRDGLTSAGPGGSPRLRVGCSGRESLRSRRPSLPSLNRPTRRCGLRMCLSEDERRLLWEKIEDLDSEMNVAVSEENYSRAAELRDEIARLKSTDPYSNAEAELSIAVANERYEEAAALRKKMKEVGKPPVLHKKEKKLQALELALATPITQPADSLGIKANSDTVTRGVRIQTVGFYLPDPSSPSDGRFMFGYNVTITNLNNETCQLLSRTWLIKTRVTPSDSKTQVVSGSGVIGRQPVLGPNESFTYSSLCPLSLDESYLRNLPQDRVLGSMEGSYLMVTGAVGQTGFQAIIDPFYFILPVDVEIF